MIRFTIQSKKVHQELGVQTWGGALIFKGGYHAQVQKYRKRVVFQGEARTG